MELKPVNRNFFCVGILILSWPGAGKEPSSVKKINPYGPGSRNAYAPAG